RRRHTRFSRDWSSDVCSSDLYPALLLLSLEHADGDAVALVDERRVGLHAALLEHLGQLAEVPAAQPGALQVLAGPGEALPQRGRSEERRVGERWRCGLGRGQR